MLNSHFTRLLAKSHLALTVSRISAAASGVVLAGVMLATLPGTPFSGSSGGLLQPRAAWAQSQDYKLGPDDALSVSVLDHPELSVARIQVDPGGKVRLPQVGSIMVTGKTVTQVAEIVRRALSKQLQHPDVTVTLLQARAQKVFVSGAVQKPGIYDISPDWRVSEVLTAAGGLTGRPELVTATLSRGKNTAIPLDIKTILHDGSSAANLKLRAGDVIRVTDLTLPVRVAGQVKTPGAYDVLNGATVSDALALAGGFAPRAAPRKVTITRSNGSVSTLDVSQDADGNPVNGADSSLKLQPGDLIVVPESTDRIAVLGAVDKPGYYDIELNSPLNLAQALNVAGGANPKAALTRATMVRADGTSVPLDLFGLTVLGDQSKNIELQPGDIITVPEATGVTVFGAVRTPGTYNVEEGRSPRVLDVLTQAGGLSVPPEDANISLLHKGTALPTDATPSVANPTGAAMPASSTLAILNSRVFDGDTISVEELKPMLISISGEVNKPGIVEVRQGTSLVDVITRAGGATSKATLSNVTVNHNDQTVQKVDIYDAVTNGAIAPPLELRSGDYIVVPESKRRVYVYGAVTKPDYYAVPEHDTLTVGEALSLAGSTRPDAKLTQIGILRQTPDGVKTTVLNLNENKGKTLALETPVQPGEAIYVPVGKQPTSFWQKLGTVAGALNIFRVF